MKKIKAVVTTLSIMIILALCFGGTFINYVIGQYDVETLFEHERFSVGEIEIAPEDVIDKGELPVVEVVEKDILKNDDIINVLLVGSDGRTKNERGRSDSMMIGTIDMKHKKLKLTSLLRDTYVELPGTDKNGEEYGWNKLNVAYAYGDASFLIETIEHNFKIKIDKYAVVNFSLFRQIIDTIGGIDLNITEMEASYLKGRSLAEGGPNRGKVKEGWNNMDGWLALEYARARNEEAGPFIITDANGKETKLYNDFARTARQRHVIETIFNKMRTEDIATLLKIATDCMDYTRTNITLAELTTYLYSVMSIGVSSIDQLQIPMRGAYEDKRLTGSVLYMNTENFEKNINSIRQFIFEE